MFKDTTLFDFVSFDKSEILFDLTQTLINEWLQFIIRMTCTATLFYLVVLVDSEVSSLVRSSGETNEEPIDWREPVKNQFEWGMNFLESRKRGQKAEQANFSQKVGGENLQFSNLFFICVLPGL